MPARRPPLLSVEQVAEILKLNVRTIRNYVRSGALKATRIGKQYRIGLADLETFTGRPVESHDDRARARRADGWRSPASSAWRASRRRWPAA